VIVPPAPSVTTGICSHPLVQSQSPGGKCLVCGTVKRGVQRRQKTMLTAFAIGRDAEAGVLAVPSPTPHVAAVTLQNRPQRWRVPKAEVLPDAPAVLDAEGVATLLRRCDAELMRRKFSAFVKGAWEVMNPGVPLVWGKHMQAICDHIQWSYEELFRVRRAARMGVKVEAATPPQAVQNLLINVPPRSAKSTIVAVFAPVWAWLHDPSLKIRCTSGNLRVSDRDSDFSRDLIESPWFQETFAPEWKLRGDRKAKRKWENTAGGIRISMPMGAVVVGEGTDVIVLDDPHDARDVYSERKRNSVITKWSGSLRNRVNNPKRHLRICIMQRLHEADFSGYWLATTKPVHLCIPMEFEADRACSTPMLDEETGEPWRDWRTEPGELMLPEYFDREFVAGEKVGLGSYGYAGQHQQRPAPEDGGLFRKSWFIGTRDAPRGFDLAFDEKGFPIWETLPRIDQLYVSVDCAFKDGEQNDFVSIQVIGRQGRMRYVLDNVTRHFDLPATLTALKDVLTRWSAGGRKVSAILIEEAANGASAIKALQTAGAAGVIAIKPEGGKFSRANAVAPACEAGDVMIPNHAKWRDAWLHEMAVFPNGAHDDQVDAFTQALNYMSGSLEVARLLDSCKW
jgi:predicted phage terminase large subunit-like protein